MTANKKMSTRTLVLAGALTALVIILQYLGSFIRFGTFSVSLVLIPIVIGAATCGVSVASWLGLVFGVMVFATGDANLFLTINYYGTVITVLLKGVLCGTLSALAYKGANAVFKKFAPKNHSLYAVFVAALVCPLVNTGIFLLGCVLFFMETMKELANGGNVFIFMIVGLVGLNFVFELLFNMILSPVVSRLINYRNK